MEWLFYLGTAGIIAIAAILIHKGWREENER